MNLEHQDNYLEDITNSTPAPVINAQSAESDNPSTSQIIQNTCVVVGVDNNDSEDDRDADQMDDPDDPGDPGDPDADQMDTGGSPANAAHAAYYLSEQVNEELYNMMNRIIEQRTIQLENDMLNAALLESRELYEQTDTMSTNEDMKINEDCVRYSKINIPQKRKQTCSICISNFKCSDNLYKISCNHLFHKECLDEWVKHKQECPVCRSSITCTELKN